MGPNLSIVGADPLQWVPNWASDQALSLWLILLSTLLLILLLALATKERDGGRTAGNASSILQRGSTIVTLASEPDMSEEEDPQDDTRRTPELLPKHKIFLSHSGAQKPFVEQLCVDLENAGNCPFFDQRDESLPKGERFPDLILEAAQKCEVAVVVLSDDFLKSKWSILELVTFVEAQQSSNPNLKILPLFYKLRVSELKQQLGNKQLMAKWREFATKDPRIDPVKCIGAVRVLSSINGEEFAKHGGSEVAYRRAIVASICRHSRPELSFNVAAMQGRKRVCDIIIRKLKTQQNNEAGVRPAMLGLHGMGGMGKTLICKALCNYFHSEYAGRVCHAELQIKGDISQIYQKMLRDLTDINEGLLLRATDLHQFQDLLKVWLPKRPVFLAVDNVLDVHSSTLEWSLPFILKSVNPESTVIFTSRSLEIVEALVGSKAACLSVPPLQKAEALNILLQNAVPNRTLSSFKGQEMEILEMCIDRCLFSSTNRNQVSSTTSVENEGYHPLALRALGSYLRDIHPSEPLQWHKKLSVSGQWKIFHKHSVFDILRTGYDTLPTSLDKLLYMDIALFAPRQKLDSLRKLCEWLQGIHNLSEEAVLYKLRLFGKKSLLELWDDEGTTRVVVHDLYVEFAEYAIQLEDTRRWCVYQRGAEMLPNCLESSPAGSHWPDLVRICLLDKSRGYIERDVRVWLLTGPNAILRFSGEKLAEWANVQVLCIHSLGVKHLDIGPLKCVRSLDLQSDTLETLTCSCSMDQLRFVKLNCGHLREGPSFKKCVNLQELAAHFSSLQHIFLPYPTSCMKVLDLLSWDEPLPGVLDLGHMASLQELSIAGIHYFHYIEFGVKLSIAGLSSLRDLRSLVLNRLPIRGSLPGLEGLISLQRLTLNGCHELNKLPKLCTLTKLEVLDVSNTEIEDLEGVDKLPQLRGLYCVGCRKLRSLPDLRSSPMLREVFTQKCKNLSMQPAVSEACSLVTTFAEKIVREFFDFLYVFGNWSRGEASFQRVLDTCPTRTVCKNMAPALIETDQAFVDACTEMHKMAAAGRTQQEFDAEKDSAICSRLISLVTDPHATNYDLRAFWKGSRWRILRDRSHYNLRT